MPSPHEMDHEEIARRLAQADGLYTPFQGFQAWLETSVDRVSWDSFLERLEAERATATTESLELAVRAALRAAAIDSGAIEGLYQTDRGFTFMVAFEHAGWESAIEQKGEDVRALFEAQLEGYEAVLDVSTQARPVSEAWIRQLHETICAPQKTCRVMTPEGWRERPFVKGKYKESPNHVVLPDGSIYSYAPVQTVSAEMGRLMNDVRSVEFEKSHPVVQAAFVHHSLTVVHPFMDGNGRVARALASVYLYRAASIPLIVYSDLRDLYLDALRTADDGRLARFSDFILDRALDTLGEITRLLKESRLGGLDSSVTSLKSLLTSQGGLTLKETDDVADRLIGMVESEAKNQIDGLTLPPDVTATVRSEHLGGATAPLSHFRSAYGARRVSLQIYSQPPAQASVESNVEVLVSTEADSRFALLLREARTKETLPVRLDDIYPSESPSFRQRLHSWVRLLLTEQIKQVHEEAANALAPFGHERGDGLSPTRAEDGKVRDWDTIQQEFDIPVERMEIAKVVFNRLQRHLPQHWTHRFQRGWLGFYDSAGVERLAIGPDTEEVNIHVAGRGAPDPDPFPELRGSPRGENWWWKIPGRDSIPEDLSPAAAFAAGRWGNTLRSSKQNPAGMGSSESRD